MRISILDAPAGSVVNLIEASSLERAQLFYPFCRVALATDNIAPPPLSEDEAQRVAFEADLVARKEKEFAAWKEAGGKDKPPTASRGAIRVAAEKSGLVEVVDVAAAAVTDKAWLIRWQEGDAFTRAELDVLLDGKDLTPDALDSIFALAQTIVLDSSALYKPGRRL